MTRKILKTLGEFLIYLVIIGGIVWGVPTFLAWKFHTEYPIAAITSGSMWPVLKTGDLVFIKSVPKTDLALGDIIVWKNPNGSGFTIHRIVKLDTDTLTTKGDANFSEDTPVAYDKVVGRAIEWNGTSPIRVPYLGYISMWSVNLKGVVPGLHAQN